jgi:putative spermidine/putrescine transport system substrate-binding protein
MDSNLSRRQFLTRLGVGTSALILGAGCNQSGTAVSDSSATRTITLAQDIQPATIQFYGTGTLDAGAKIWSELEKATSAKLAFKDNSNDAGPVIAQMISGSAAADYDLGGLLGGAESVLASAGAILPWDLSKIPNLSSAWPWVKQIEHTNWKGKQYGIPLVLNADSMIYLPDQIKAVNGYESGIIDSYAAIFDPRLKGRTSMEDAWVNSVIFAAIYLKGSNKLSIKEPGNLTETELKGVMEFLIEKKREGQFRKFWSGWEQGVEVMRSGEVWAMTGWEPIVKALVGQGINAKYAVPKEGYEGWSIDLLLHSGAEKRRTIELCHQVANWFQAGPYGAALASSRGYVVPNDATSKFIETSNFNDSKQVIATIKHVQEKISKNIYWQNVRPDNYRLYEEWWSKLRSAI